jgi:RNase P/RNase MRP subunit POP5
VRWHTRGCTLDEDSKWFVAEVLLQGQDASGQTLARARRHALNRIHAAAEQYRALGPPGTEVLVHVVPTSGSIGVPIKELDRKGALHNLYQSTLPAV